MKTKGAIFLFLLSLLAVSACKPSSGSQVLGMSPKDYYSHFSYSKTGADSAAHYHYMAAQNVDVQTLTDGRRVVAHISIFLLSKFQFVLGYDELTMCADGKTVVSVTKKTVRGQATLHGTSLKLGDVAAALADVDSPVTTVQVEFARDMNTPGLKRKMVPFTLSDSTAPMADVLAQKYTVAPNGAAACGLASPSPSPTSSPTVPVGTTTSADAVAP